MGVSYISASDGGRISFNDNELHRPRALGDGVNGVDSRLIPCKDNRLHRPDRSGRDLTTFA